MVLVTDAGIVVGYLLWVLVHHRWMHVGQVDLTHHLKNRHLEPVVYTLPHNHHSNHRQQYNLACKSIQRLM
jgi:hypothetical protein